MIDYSNFQKSLKNLEVQFKRYPLVGNEYPEFLHEALKESVIHRFEICYDCLWKVLKRHLIANKAFKVIALTDSPKIIFYTAGNNGLLDSPIEQWEEYVNVRIGTTHDYSAKKADKCLTIMKDFISDAIELYKTISGEPWKEEEKKKEEDNPTK